MDRESREKTAFSLGQGLWEFTVMVFGLSNGPAIFERLMETKFMGLSKSACLDVLGRLWQGNLKLHPPKCQIFQHQTLFLGHIVSDAVIATNPENVMTVAKWPLPWECISAKELLGLGKLLYYCIVLYCIVTLCTKLCRHGQSLAPGGDSETFPVGRRVQSGICGLEGGPGYLSSSSLPLTDGHFILDTDASDKGGAVLSQVTGRVEQVVAFYSQVLSQPK